MAQLIPYINFADKGTEAIAFYKSVFGGDADVTLVKDSAMAAQMPTEWGERIMHLDFKAGDIHFMGSDLISDQAGLERGNGYNIAVACDSVEQLREYFGKLSADGSVVFEPSDAGWGDMFGQCIDGFGVQWMLNYAQPK